MTHVTDRLVEPASREDVRWRWDGFLARSYLFSLEPIDPKPAELREVPLPDGHLFISPDYYCHVQRVDAAFVVLIGYCIDLEALGATESDIALSLLQRALRDGIEAMLASTDHLTGRFAVICHVAGRWHVFPDANATRTIYYAEDRPAIASHSTILGSLIGAAPRADIFKHYWCALPGNASAVPGVRVLPANFVLDLDSRQLRRFWPRSERVERPVADVIDELDTLLARTAAATVARWKPLLSLTAGVDSRLSLSILYGTPDLVAFTYDRDEEDAVDVEGARRLCEMLGIEHRRLPLVERWRAERAYQLIESIVECSFDKNVAPIFLSAFGDMDGAVIHIRSSLTGIGKAFWRYHPGMPTSFDPANWLYVSLSKLTTHLPYRQEAAEYLRAEMQRFFALVGYDSVDPRSPQIMGYDVWDLLYAEHRMSTWHAPALSAFDMAVETSMLFNCRRILDILMSVPLLDRRKATLFHMIIARHCPQIADIPVNPRPRRTVSELGAAAYRQFKRRIGLVRAIEARLKF